MTAHHKMMPISGLYPPNILPDEILHEGEDRLRAVWVDSCNPLMSYADSAAYRKAFESLELLVVVDVAMTETAELADYVLPASSQFEKWEATGFNAEFPENFFHLRPPLAKPKGESLPEPEMYTRLMVEMGVIPGRFPWLERIARFEPDISSHQLFLSAFILALKKNPSWAAYAPSILYKTFGQYLPNEGAAAAIVLPLAIDYAKKHANAVKRAGIQGNPLTLGINLFKKIISSPSGTIISQHTFEEMWKFIRNKDGKIHLGVDRALNGLRELAEAPQQNSEYPFILMAGERRAYNANQIYRTPQWRKTDKSGALRLHPSDAEELGAVDEEEVWCISSRGRIKVSVQLDDSVQKHVVTLPHGYGMSYQGEVVGPAINVLTDSQHCDDFTKTPYHKYVSVRLERLAS